MIALDISTANYHDAEVAKDYLSCSQIKLAAECESAWHARYVTGKNVDESSPALIQGSYLDVLLTGTPDEIEAFQSANRDSLWTKTGTFRAPIKDVHNMVDRIKADPQFMASMTGENQVIMIGEIAGQPTRIMIDCIPSALGWIVDLKKISRPDKNVWCDSRGAYVPFWQAYGYHWQATIYREIFRQNTGEDRPFVLAVVEAESPHATFGLPLIGDAMDEVETAVNRIAEIKQGAEPISCDRCKWCKSQSAFGLREPAYF